MVNLIDKLDSAIINRAKKRWAEHQPKKAHNVTDYATGQDADYEGTCLRKQCYEWMGVEPLWEYVQAKHLYRAQFGDVVEDFIIGLLKEEMPDWKFERQKKLEIQVKELKNPIHGRIDDILVKWKSVDNGPTETPSEAICLEVKSSHGRKFTSKQFGIVANGPDKTHLNQLGMYKKYFPYEWKDVEFSFIYFSREDFNRKPFTDGKDMNLPTDFDFKWWMILEDYLERKMLPPRNFKSKPDKGKDDFPCSWCSQLGNCYFLHDNI